MDTMMDEDAVAPAPAETSLDRRTSIHRHPDGSYVQESVTKCTHQMLL